MLYRLSQACSAHCLILRARAGPRVSNAETGPIANSNVRAPWRPPLRRSTVVRDEEGLGSSAADPR